MACSGVPDHCRPSSWHLRHHTLSTDSTRNSKPTTLGPELSSRANLLAAQNDVQWESSRGLDGVNSSMALSTPAAISAAETIRIAGTLDCSVAANLVTSSLARAPSEIRSIAATWAS